jgi:hypothetical protein
MSKRLGLEVDTKIHNVRKTLVLLWFLVGNHVSEDV